MIFKKLQHKKFCKRCKKYRPHYTSKSVVCCKCADAKKLNRVQQHGRQKPEVFYKNELANLKKKLDKKDGERYGI